MTGEPWAQDSMVNLSSRRRKKWEKSPVRGPAPHSNVGEGEFVGMFHGGGGGHCLADLSVCPSRQAPCCVRVAVSCWPSARCWPSSPSCCPVERARGECAPWLATCRQQQASDGDLALWGGRTGKVSLGYCPATHVCAAHSILAPSSKRHLQTLTNAGTKENRSSL